VAFEPLDVVVVPFPFTDRLATKRRPAVLLSRRGTLREGQAILAMVTSSTFESWASDVELHDRTSAGLTVACRVRFKVFTLDEGQIVRGIGRLSERDAHSVRVALGLVFGLA